MAGGILPAGRRVELQGIAFDSGAGLKMVEVSLDGGENWLRAKLGEDLGRFSFRQWRLPVTFSKKGAAVLMVRAGNNKGEVQPATADWNPAGYRRHVVESTAVTIA
jgi:sulfite dehydrogenase